MFASTDQPAGTKIFLGMVRRIFGTAAVLAVCGFGLIACSRNDDAGESLPPAPTFNIGGTVTGLPSGGSVTLGNGRDRVVVGADGRFVFDAPQAEGTAYRVGVLAAPDDRRCEVTRGRGSMPAASVDDVAVDCSHIVNWQVNGTIRTTVLSQDGNTLYIGGHFSVIGPPTGSFAKLNTKSGKTVGAFARISGTVNDVAPDGEGGWYVAGSFVRVNDTEVASLVHVFEDGSLDEQFAPGSNAPVYAIARSGSILFVGGAFTHIGGAARSHLAALDTSTGKALTWSAGADGDVRRVVAAGSTVYVAGGFLQVGGLPRSGLAALGMKSGDTLPWNPSPRGGEYPDGKARVNSVMVADALVYIGGSFDAIGGAARKNVAAVDPVTGIASAWHSECDGEVNAMAQVDGVIYLTGQFSYVGGQPRSGLAAVDATAGATLDWHPEMLTVPYDDAPWPGTGYSIAVLGDTVYVGCSCNFPSQKLVAFSRTTGKAVDWPGGAPRADGPVLALHVDGENVLAGGSFSFVFGQFRSGLAAIDTRTGRGTDWGPIVGMYSGIGDPYVGSGVEALLRSGGTLFAGGRFNVIDGQWRSALAAFNLPTGDLSNWGPELTSPFDDLQVEAMSLAGSTLYFAGRFNLLQGLPRNGLAAVGARTGAAEPWNPPFQLYDSTRATYALAVADRVVYVGGAFSNLFGVARAGLAAFDRMTGELTPWNPGAQLEDLSAGEVRAMVLSGFVLQVGGRFDRIGGQKRRNIAALDAENGAVRNDWGPAEGLAQAVSALAPSDGALYFGTVDGTVGRIDATTGALQDWGATFAGAVHSLSFAPKTVYVGGSPGTGNPVFVPK